MTQHLLITLSVFTSLVLLERWVNHNTRHTTIKSIHEEFYFAKYEPIIHFKKSTQPIISDKLEPSWDSQSTPR